MLSQPSRVDPIKEINYELIIFEVQIIIAITNTVEVLWDKNVEDQTISWPLPKLARHP